MISRLLYSSLILASPVALAAEPLWRVDPALEGGFPAVSVEGLEGAVSIQLRVTDLRNPELVLLDASLETSEPDHSFFLPSVDSDTYVQVSAWIDKAETETADFIWTTLLRPEGESLLSYQGMNPTHSIPDDFEAYWQRAKDELASVPMNPVVNDLSWGDTETGRLHEVILDSVGGVKFVARFTIPRAAYDESGNVVKQFPAIIVMPGYGAEQPPMDRTPSGFITMSVNPRHHGPSKEYWRSPVEHLIYGIDNPETYYYRAAYLDNLRAAQYLLSRPEVDVTRVAAEGGSQGGLFAIALAALEPRIKVVCSNVTALAAIEDGLLLNQRGTTQSLRARIDAGGQDAENIKRSLSYIDGANMATLVRVPVQINMGGQDPVCHFLTGIATAHRLPADVPREVHVYPNAKHEVPGPMRQANGEWVQKWLGLEETPRFPGRILSPPAVE